MLSPSLYSVFKNAKNTLSNFQEHIFGGSIPDNRIDNISINSISPIPTPLLLVEKDIVPTTATTNIYTQTKSDPLSELCRLVRHRLLTRQVPLCCDKCKNIIVKNIKIINNETLSLTTLGNSLCKNCKYLFISNNSPKKKNISLSIHASSLNSTIISSLQANLPPLPSPPPSCNEIDDDLVLDVVGFNPTSTLKAKNNKKIEVNKKKRKVSYDDNLLISYEPSLSLSNSIRRKSIMMVLPMEEVKVMTPSFKEISYPPKISRPILEKVSKTKSSKEYSKIHYRYEIVERNDRLCSPSILKSLAIKKK